MSLVRRQTQRLDCQCKSLSAKDDKFILHRPSPENPMLLCPSFPLLMPKLIIPPGLFLDPHKRRFIEPRYT